MGRRPLQGERPSSLRSSHGGGIRLEFWISGSCSGTTTRALACREVSFALHQDARVCGSNGSSGRCHSQRRSSDLSAAGTSPCRGQGLSAISGQAAAPYLVLALPPCCALPVAETSWLGAGSWLEAMLWLATNEISWFVRRHEVPWSPVLNLMEWAPFLRPFEIRDQWLLGEVLRPAPLQQWLTVGRQSASRPTLLARRATGARQWTQGAVDKKGIGDSSAEPSAGLF